MFFILSGCGKIESTTNIAPPLTVHGGDIIVTLSGSDIPPRAQIIRQLITQGFTGFLQQPYASGNNSLVTRNTGNSYTLTHEIKTDDDLDRRLKQYSGSMSSLVVPESTWSHRSGMYLFKTETDLQNLGYHVISHRWRINTDKDYRRFNIAQAFRMLGNIRIIMPGEIIDFLQDTHFDDKLRENYQYGYAILEGEEETDYGGGLCGASTAIYQGILTNTYLNPLKIRPHTIRYSDLYNAYINGVYTDTPGIDSAIYAGQIDFRVQNTSKHPIILVMNYDGTSGGKEEVFTLGYPSDQGGISFIRRQGNCFIWEINNEKVTRCYNSIQ